jgi:hypothetical protein
LRGAGDVVGLERVEGLVDVCARFLVVVDAL